MVETPDEGMLKRSLNHSALLGKKAELIWQVKLTETGAIPGKQVAQLQVLKEICITRRKAAYHIGFGFGFFAMKNGLFANLWRRKKKICQFRFGKKIFMYLRAWSYCGARPKFIYFFNY